MPLTAPVIHLSAKDREEIDRWLDAHGTPQQVALQSRIVLASAGGHSDSAVARDLEINRKTVTLWRARFALEGIDSLWEVAPGRGRKPTLGPEKIKAIIDATIQKLALKYAQARNFFFLSRGYNFPIALEGALKLKEISYIHAEGYSAAEMKHGPIALVDSSTPAVFVIPRDSMYEKTLANLAMIRARKGPIIAIASEGDEEISKKADDVIYLPRALEPLYPILATIPLQLFAYYIAVARGCDVDKPRNLAKSVTVE